MEKQWKNSSLFQRVCIVFVRTHIHTLAPTNNSKFFSLSLSLPLSVFNFSYLFLSSTLLCTCWNIYNNTLFVSAFLKLSYESRETLIIRIFGISKLMAYLSSLLSSRLNAPLWCVEKYKKERESHFCAAAPNSTKRFFFRASRGPELKGAKREKRRLLRFRERGRRWAAG